MKSMRLLILLSVVFLILTGCGNKGKINNGENAGEEGNNNPPSIEITPPTDESEDNVNEHDPISKTEEPNNEGAKHEDPIAYFVNEKYYIKPVNNEDEEKVVLLTFDDSPAGDTTRTILDLLDKYDAKVIWFVNGYYADRNRDLLKEIHDRGHIIGNHTWWHENLKTLTPEKTREEIVSINDLVEEVTGVRPIYFRAPYGVYSEEAKKVLKEENMQYMNWTWGSLDWELKTSEEIEKNVIDNIHSGANILFHDKRITADALENILKSLSDAGYKFVLPTEVRVQE